MALLKEAGLKLKRISFQYLLQAARGGGVASSNEGGDMASSNEAAITDMDRLLDHIKVTLLWPIASN